MKEAERYLAAMTEPQVAALVAAPGQFVVLQPVGSVEPHGPHLALGTDCSISEGAALGAAAAIATMGHGCRIAPTVPYGVTECARGFAGAVSVPARELTAFLRSVIRGWLGNGVDHVCLINNHLEPGQDLAIREAATGFEVGAASVACPLSRRWARTLSAEFKSGACHAGRYETSIVMAHQPEWVDEEARATLPEVPVSLSEKLSAGVTNFRDMGLDRAYAGNPAVATASEGEELLALLATMVVTEVTEALALREADA